MVSGRDAWSHDKAATKERDQMALQGKDRERQRGDIEDPEEREDWKEWRKERGERGRKRRDEHRDRRRRGDDDEDS